MNGLLVIGVSGAAGAVGRHLLDVGLRRRFPDGPSIGILVANVIGSAVLGVVVGLASGHVLDPDLRLAITVGFCGGLTTFSTFVAQVADELDHGRRSGALRWAAVMMVAGVVAASVGVAVGRSF